MLVLRRKLGEGIRIGGGVTIRVLEFRGNQVHLGLDAPPEVKIFREEIYQAMMEQAETEGRGTYHAGTEVAVLHAHVAE